MSALSRIFRTDFLSVAMRDGTNVPAEDDALRARSIVLTGALTTDSVLVLPASAGVDWIVKNDTTGGHRVSVRSTVGGAGTSITQGSTRHVVCDGTQMLSVDVEPSMRLSADSFGGSGFVGDFSLPSAAGGVGETLGLIEVAPLVGTMPATIMVEADVVCLGDDASQSYSTKVMRTFRWSGSALTPVNSAYSIYEGDDTGSASAGLWNTATQIKLIVGGTSEWRWFGTAKVTLIKLLA